MNSNKIVNVATPDSATDAANKSYVDTSIPIGGIIMWSGTTGTSLPSNWKLCDGSTYNGIKTPDLRGRFVLSSANNGLSVNGFVGLGVGLTPRSVDAIGGAETVSLTESQMPSHNHKFSGYKYQPYAYSSPGDVISSPKQSDWVGSTLETTNAGSGTAHENMPPFYVLAFIMRIS